MQAAAGRQIERFVMAVTATQETVCHIFAIDYATTDTRGADDEYRDESEQVARH